MKQKLCLYVLCKDFWDIKITIICSNNNKLLKLWAKHNNENQCVLKKKLQIEEC